MLEVQGLRAGYGRINVLWDVSLTFPKGELTAIVGPNGAGKTTLLRAITGLLPHEGEIRLDGAPLGRSRTWTLIERGLAMVPEGRLVFRDMSVEENLALGAYPARCRGRLRHNLDTVYGLFPRLRARRGQLAGSLSGGEAQMLAMGRGMMSEPRVLLVDEPSLGLAPVIVQEIFRIISRLKAEGTTIVLVEQNTHMALAVADGVHLMRSGRVLLSERAGNVDLARLHDLYLALET